MNLDCESRKRGKINRGKGRKLTLRDVKRGMRGKEQRLGQSFGGKEKQGRVKGKQKIMKACERALDKGNCELSLVELPVPFPSFLPVLALLYKSFSKKSYSLGGFKKTTLAPLAAGS